ncbi:hypothetical protein GALMADRAFT_146615 [Galerina marginata CBS 339.88]|uniref:Uncharacterized protein n=1 Tax=Galerina marginata (strain CBS 339.88) TaxID=685588 RepID=A0A067SB84_GALM3|nr:hypothetical protein GALMADRAFT_146615 [Galerina marginata CBS 339.88]
MRVLGTDVITQAILPTPVSNLTHNYFQSNHPKKLWLIAQSYEFLFSDYDPANLDAVRPSTPFFLVDMTPAGILADTISFLTRAMSLPLSDLHCVTHLHVIVNAEIPFAVDLCRHVFLSPRSIKTVTINRNLIAYLHWFRRYPDLRKIRIEGWRNDEQDYVINLFQKLRNAAGHPVLILGVLSS